MNKETFKNMYLLVVFMESIESLLMIPIVLAGMIPFAFALIDFAENSTAKIDGFLQSNVNAMDCAFVGVSLEECSPGLYDYDFNTDLKEFNEMNNNFVDDLKDKLDSRGISIEDLSQEELLELVQDFNQNN